jgi:hypothetical protein
MLVDYERLVLELKAIVAAKPHHGQRELLAEIARLEVANTLDSDVQYTGRSIARSAASEQEIPALKIHRQVPVTGTDNRRSTNNAEPIRS